MAGPHPVVGLSTEFSHGCRRCSDKADIGVSLVNDHVVDILVVEAGYADPAAGIVSLSLCGEFAGRILHGLLCKLFFLSLIFYLLVVLEGLLVSVVENVGNIRHVLEESD